MAAAPSLLHSFHRLTMQKQKALKTLQTMRAQPCIKARERAKGKVKNKITCEVKIGFSGGEILKPPFF